MSKGSVMTVQVHPVETEGDSRSAQHKPTGEQKQANHNLINLWDERAYSARRTRKNDHKKDEKVG